MARPIPEPPPRPNARPSGSITGPRARRPGARQGHGPPGGPRERPAATAAPRPGLAAPRPRRSAPRWPRRRPPPPGATGLVVDEGEIEEILERLDAGRASHTRVSRRVHAEGPRQEVEERRPRAALVVRVEIEQRSAAPGGENLEGHGPAPDLDPSLVGHQDPFRAPDGHQRSL